MATLPPDNKTVTTNQDFDNLAAEYGKVSFVNSPAQGSVATSTFGACPVEGAALARARRCRRRRTTRRVRVCRASWGVRLRCPGWGLYEGGGDADGGGVWAVAGVGGNCDDISANGTTGCMGRWRCVIRGLRYQCARDPDDEDRMRMKRELELAPLNGDSLFLVILPRHFAFLQTLTPSPPRRQALLRLLPILRAQRAPRLRMRLLRERHRQPLRHALAFVRALLVHDQPERGVHAYRAGGGDGARELGVEWEWGWLGEWEWWERQQGGEAGWGTGGGGRVGGGGVCGWGDGDGVNDGDVKTLPRTGPRVTAIITGKENGQDEALENLRISCQRWKQNLPQVAKPILADLERFGFIFTP
ncbi:hypothetical protein B0H13DRAFT_2289069 [Mycena leptocephala]|nr:hypothetical protein B0H13DRAFT_2289069 [Mycena leptocephala]